MWRWQWQDAVLSTPNWCRRSSALSSYVLKIVGGGSSLDSIVDYNEEEIYRYNSPLDK